MAQIAAFAVRQRGVQASTVGDAASLHKRGYPAKPAVQDSTDPNDKAWPRAQRGQAWKSTQRRH